MKRIVFFALISLLIAACSSKDDGSIMGTANLDTGDPIVGATVKLYDENTQLLRDAQTGGDGGFAFTGLESGNYYIGATATVDGETWDTGNLPQLVFVSDEIVKEVALTLTKKE